MTRALLIGTAAAVLLSAGLAAQGRNFGGTWTIDAEKTSAAGGGMGGGARGGGGGGGGIGVARGGGDAGGAVVARGGGGGGGGRGGAVMAGGGGGGARGGGGVGMASVSAGMTLTIDANTFTIAQGETSTSYRTDGTLTNVDNPMRKATAKASWSGDKLVIETTAEMPSGPMVTHATWYLEGESLVRENKSTGPDGQEITRKTFFKRASH